ncbi:50S ribosomal protein L9 [Oceanispirochaeta sp.]|jgi:large subunit ribosomal protein L9|uniref:50S ribosomal protein L9 n=1 Tax=Oceanispirochaeta sp. TaxID=2035350 RepID=UPI00262E7317|nr:50S ribosomal protein L9 [Oceanispirochaeta sp.]MDA3956629.1 50S ribosomal protein L9 [Oceanispirochaeta sp.]
MKIILNQDMSSLGEEGDVKVVADGYARNFLIPKKMAVAYNKANLNMFEQKKVSIEKRKESKRKDAMGLKDRLSNETLIIDMPAGDKGKLFGAVTPATIVDELNKIGLVIEKKKIEISGNSIKLTGSFTVKVKLYGNETADLKVTINGIQTEGSESRSSRKAETKVETAAVAEESTAAEVTESSAAVEDAETVSENTTE